MSAQTIPMSNQLSVVATLAALLERIEQSGVAPHAAANASTMADLLRIVVLPLMDGRYGNRTAAEGLRARATGGCRRAAGGQAASLRLSGVAAPSPCPGTVLHTAMNKAAMTGPMTKPLIPNTASPPSVDNRTR